MTLIIGSQLQDTFT